MPSVVREREREAIRKNRVYLIIRQIADDCALVAVRAARRYLKLFLSFFLFLFCFVVYNMFFVFRYTTTRGTAVEEVTHLC